MEAFSERRDSNVITLVFDLFVKLSRYRGVKLDHSVVNRWVLEYAPQLEEEFRKNHKKKVNASWRMDEAYIKIKGNWHYLYGAIDKWRYSRFHAI